MRYFKLHLTTPDGAYHPVDRVMAEYPGVQREALLHLNLLQDETGVALYHLRGDAGRLATALDEEPAALSYDVFNTDGERFNVHLHFRPDSPATDLLRIAEKHKLIIDPPLEFTRRGGLLMSIAGTQEGIRRAAADLPGSVGRFTLERMGQYHPERDSLVQELTDRQRDVIGAAVDLGYYSTPRAVTHDDIAEELDCSAGTVGEHLRKAEAKVFAELGTSVTRSSVTQ
ncbi:MAG: helix-turn-helix domain-containing protein [Haloarculaceae archaeon]